MKHFLLAAICLILAAGGFAQSTALPCSSMQAKQFDFWVGSWNLEWQDAKGNKQTGSNLIRKTLNDCVIEENFDGGGKPPFYGKSVSLFDANWGKWKQTWVDNSGAYLDLEGEFADGKMILSREFISKQGKKVMQRMTFHDIQKDSFIWDWERSDDDGKTWKINWRINYTRKADDAFDLRSVKAFIDKANESYDERFKHNDEAYYIEKYMADACTMPPGMERLCGREKIRKYFYGNGENTSVKILINAEEVSGNYELVVETGSYSVNDLSGKILEKGKFIATWKPENGVWKMHSEIWSSDSGGN